MKLRIGRIFAGTTALAAAMVVGIAGDASAAETPGIDWDHVWSAKGVKVYVLEHGDVISVCDTSANGRAAYIDVYEWYQGNYYHAYEAKASKGWGTCVTHQASQGGQYDLDEAKDKWDKIHVYFGGDEYTYDDVKVFSNDH